MAMRYVTRRRHSMKLVIFIIIFVLAVSYTILVSHPDSGFHSAVGNRDNERRNLYPDKLVAASSIPPGMSKLEFIKKLIDLVEKRNSSLMAEYSRLAGNDASLMNSTGTDTIQQRVGIKQVVLGSNVYSSLNVLNCSSIDEIQLVKRLGKGTSKEVYLGRYRGRDVAVKYVSSAVKDVTACRNRKKYWKETECFLFANYKIMKEVLLAMQLQHPHILKLLGFCVRSEENSPILSKQGVVSVTEIGTSINRKLFTRMTWEERLRFSLGIASLLDYLEHSPMGSLLITDFKLDQMLLVDGVLKLGDLDDINNIESDCQDTNCGILQQNCKKKICAIENTELDIQCVNNKCIGFNAKFNLFKFNHHVFTRVLHNPPANVSFEVKNIQDRLNALNITATELYTSLLAIQYT